MPSAIGPGDWVERDPNYAGAKDPVDQKLVSFTSGGWPVFGVPYRVRDMRMMRHPDGHYWQGLRLAGIVASFPGHPDAFFQAEAFKPVYRPRAELIQSLLQPSPELEAA